jgi:hypothetical protein
MVNPENRAQLDMMERAGYLPALRSIARNACVPFWWHGVDEKGTYRIFHNGTLCILQARDRLIGVTAGHVYEQYLKEKRNDSTLVCQFGSATVEPEKRLIAWSKHLDLATFELSAVVVGASGAYAYAPNEWPPTAVLPGQALLYGGYPGNLRVEQIATADLPFQWFASAPLSVTPENVKLHLDGGNFHQPLVGSELPNCELGGMSGGPVFRLVSAPLERLELVAFIYEFQDTLGLVYARPASCIAAGGEIYDSAV